MKKIKFGSIEILGCTGGLVWLAIVLLRRLPPSESSIYLLFLGILPNLGVAWTAAMLGKWNIIFVCEQIYTIKKHLILCLTIFALAILSEFIYDSFFNSPLDFNDILITSTAQLIMFFAPIALKDKQFKNYS